MNLIKIRIYNKNYSDRIIIESTSNFSEQKYIYKFYMDNE